MDNSQKLRNLLEMINPSTGERWLQRELAAFAGVHRVTLASWLAPISASSHRKLSNREWQNICYRYHNRFGAWPEGCEACFSAAGD